VYVELLYARCENLLLFHFAFYLITFFPSNLS